MYCIHCGKPYPDGSVFCMNCGARIYPDHPEIPIQAQTSAAPVEEANETSQPAAPVNPEPEQPKHTVKGSMKIPFFILAALSAVGLMLFFLIPLGRGNDPSQPATTYGEEIPWLSNRYGKLYFYETEYDGDGELTVPETVDGNPVIALSEYCFSDCDSLTTVILPDTLETIEYQAFYGCDRLRGILIPEGTLYIAGEAFADCPSLEAISIPSTLDAIDVTAFDRCPSLKYVFFAGTLEEWNLIFDGCSESGATVFCSDGECPLQWVE